MGGDDGAATGGAAGGASFAATHDAFDNTTRAHFPSDTHCFVSCQCVGKFARPYDGYRNWTKWVCTSMCFAICPAPDNMCRMLRSAPQHAC